MFLSRASSYALKTMIYIACKTAHQQDQPSKQSFFAHQLAKDCKMPQNYLSKVLRQLVRIGILSAEPGQTGGYRLNKKLEDIHLFEIIEPFEDIKNLKYCFFKIPFCSLLEIIGKSQMEECPLYAILKNVTLQDIVNKTLQNMKVCDIILSDVPTGCINERS
jgi:Rrf2 family transcriptional regulator, nitric oxide-sensitive transcriptional repressor